MLRMELGSSAVQIGSAGARTALHYAETFSTSADDFADRTPGIISNTGFQTGHSVIRVARFFAHPVKAMASIGRTALICGVIILLLLIIGLLGQMSGTTTTSALCADRPEDIQQLVESINTYRNEAATDELQMIFSSSYKARRMIIVIKRPMFMPDATSGGFLLDFCLYRYKIKPFIHHFSPLMAVVCPSETPSVLSGINRIQRWSQSKPPYLVLQIFFVSIYSILSRGRECHQE